LKGPSRLKTRSIQLVHTGVLANALPTLEHHSGQGFQKLQIAQKGVGVDIRSDLYSLGVVLWEMVTGRVVFRGSPTEVMYQHQHAPLPLEQLEDIPQPVAVLLEALLEKNPGRRFQNPTELLKAIPTTFRLACTCICLSPLT
jgi:serine/threonine protein kinase